MKENNRSPIAGASPRQYRMACILTFVCTSWLVLDAGIDIVSRKFVYDTMDMLSMDVYVTDTFVSCTPQARSIPVRLEAPSCNGLKKAQAYCSKTAVHLGQYMLQLAELNRRIRETDRTYIALNNEPLVEFNASVVYYTNSSERGACLFCALTGLLWATWIQFKQYRAMRSAFKYAIIYWGILIVFSVLFVSISGLIVYLVASTIM